MTRTSEAAERGREDYNESNPDPRFRPSVGRLMHKLRTLPQFEDPQATAFLVDDLMWYHLVKRRASTQLFYLLKQAHYYWADSIKAGGVSEMANQRQNNFSDSAQNPHTEDALPKSEALDLDDAQLKKEVNRVILDHYYAKSAYIPSCICGKEFDFIEEWANHVRYRIWKVLNARLENGRESSGSAPTGKVPTGG